jgi:hypothetical protein
MLAGIRIASADMDSYDERWLSSSPARTQAQGPAAALRYGIRAGERCGVPPVRSVGVHQRHGGVPNARHSPPLADTARII